MHWYTGLDARIATPNASKSPRKLPSDFVVVAGRNVERVLHAVRRFKHWNGSRLNTLSLTRFFTIQVGEASFTAYLRSIWRTARPLCLKGGLPGEH